MVQLNNITVLITGASAGIGRACARAFASCGARLILAARRTERLEQLALELETETHLLTLDVTKQQDVGSSISSLPESWSEIDVLVNNAGLARGVAKMHEGDLEGWKEMIDTNIMGLLYVTRAVVPAMVERKKGHVINIGSIAGHEVYPGGNIYCATKHAVDAITKGLRIDLVDQPIRVSTVDPGLVETEFSLARFRGDSERAKKVYEGYTPLAPEDIAEAVVWVASRPPHVQIAEIIILPTDQASATVLHKKA